MSDAKPDRDEKTGQGESTCPDVPKEIRNGYLVLPGVAHELGNLLAVVASWVQGWEQAGADPVEASSATRGVYAGLGRIRYSLNRLASPLSHPNTHLAVVDVNVVIRHALSTLGLGVKQGHKLTGVTEPDLWPVVGDFWALDLVLVNLVMEAVAASSPGSPVFVKSNNIDAESPIRGVGGFLTEGAYVRLSVHHYQDESSKRPTRPSTQESLPLCLQILEEHGGLLQRAVSPHGESQTAMFLPALARCLPVEGGDTAPPERGA